jgi:hypothetical protein
MRHFERSVLVVPLVLEYMYGALGLDEEQTCQRHGSLGIVVLSTRLNTILNTKDLRSIPMSSIQVPALYLEELLPTSGFSVAKRLIPMPKTLVRVS